MSLPLTIWHKRVTTQLKLALRKLSSIPLTLISNELDDHPQTLNIPYIINDKNNK